MYSDHGNSACSGNATTPCRMTSRLRQGTYAAVPQTDTLYIKMSVLYARRFALCAPLAKATQSSASAAAR